MLHKQIYRIYRSTQLRSVSKVERCMLGDLHLVSPETEKVGQLVSVIKRLRGVAVSEIC